MKKSVEPKLASGFRDYLPREAAAREWMVETIKGVFKSFGFVPLDTPGAEREEVLTGGDPNFKKQIFKLSLAGQDEKTALRFDLTVPLARVMAGYSGEISKPFKRYQVGNVWRGERAQAGRYREFMQFDADIVGAPSIAADAEFISLVYEALSALGLADFVIRVNNRKILNALPEYAGFSKSKMEEVLRIIDKLDKIEWKGVQAELTSGPGLKKESVARIKEFLDIKGTNGEILGGLISLFEESGASQEGIDDLAKLRANIEALGVPDENWEIDLSVARGLGYYTGMVFETIVNEYPELGSVASGGRYDDLVSRFGTASIPATGGSIGVDRLFVALEKLKLFPDFSAGAEALILNFDGESEMVCESLATELRQGGISAELYLGQEDTLRGQLAYAAKGNYPFVIIIGSEERGKETVQVKNMKERKQEEIERDEVLEYLRKNL
jgi:histidyl-tRNA synthetase